MIQMMKSHGMNMIKQHFMLYVRVRAFSMGITILRETFDDEK
jgi:hypothetical protein